MIAMHQFLSVGDEAHEKDIHDGLLIHVKEFLMELGQGVRHEVAYKSCSH